MSNKVCCDQLLNFYLNCTFTYLHIIATYVPDSKATFNFFRIAIPGKKNHPKSTYPSCNIGDWDSIRYCKALTTI